MVMVTVRTTRFADSIPDPQAANRNQQIRLRIPARMLAAWSEIAGVPVGVPAARKLPPMPSRGGSIHHFAARQVIAGTKEIDIRLDEVEHASEWLKMIATVGPLQQTRLARLLCERG